MSLLRSHEHVRRIKYHPVNQMFCREFLFELNENLIEDNPNATNFMRTQKVLLKKMLY